MKNRLQRLNHTGMEAYVFRCPGCTMDHLVSVSHTPEYKAQCLAAGRNATEWGFNGSLTSPTFSPSLLVRWSFHQQEHGFDENHVCHSFINDGRIQFLGDCTHKLAGQTVDLMEVE